MTTAPSPTPPLRALTPPIAAMALVIVLSNWAVQFPINAWLTWGAFTYPLVFLVCDLTNRALGPAAARRVAWAGDAALFATAAPGNVPSWRSLLACGFAVRALQYRYGGHARYLLARVPGAALAHGAPARELAQDDIPGQEGLLAQGWQGIAPGQAPGSLRLVAPAGGGQP